MHTSLRHIRILNSRDNVSIRFLTVQANPTSRLLQDDSVSLFQPHVEGLQTPYSSTGIDRLVVIIYGTD